MTKEDFDAILGTELTTDDGQVFVLETVKALGHGRPGGRAPFSLIFTGPPSLPQSTYTLSHPTLGRNDIFLVPIAPQKYEAIFN